MKKKYLQIRNTLRHLLPTAVVSASVAVLLESAQLFSFLTKLSVLVVANLASPDSAIEVDLQVSKTAVISIDEARYVSAYGERSPLDRCQLTNDLSDLLAKRPQMVAIDLDLSPLARANSDESNCQSNLDQLLDKESARLILLAPYPTSNEKFREVKFQWMQNRCKAGLDFAEGTLIQSFGSVTSMRTEANDRLTLAGLLHNKSKAKASEKPSPICADIARQPTRWLSDEGRSMDAANSHTKLKSINYKEVARNLALISFGSESYQKITSLEGVRVVFGGSWGQSDTFLTPLGNLHGAAVHGASLISLDYPVSELSHLWGFCLDILLGLMFGAIVKKMWSWYVAALKHDVRTRHSAASTGVLLSLVGVYLIVVLATMQIAIYLYVHHNIEIVPLLMALLMLVDGFINGPREELEESHAPPSHTHHHAPKGVTRQEHGHGRAFGLTQKTLIRLSVVVYWLKKGVLVLIVSAALFVLANHVLHYFVH